MDAEQVSTLLAGVDVKKLSDIPGGGWRVHGRWAGQRNRRPAITQRCGNHPVLGYGCRHTALGDHSRLACAELLPDERKNTAAAFLARAHAWYASHEIIIERV